MLNRGRKIDVLKEYVLQQGHAPRLETYEQAVDYYAELGVPECPTGEHMPHDGDCRVDE